MALYLITSQIFLQLFLTAHLYRKTLCQQRLLEPERGKAQLSLGFSSTRALREILYWWSRQDRFLAILLMAILRCAIGSKKMLLKIKEKSI